MLGVRCAGEFRHPVHQRAAVVWCEEPLVRVDNEAVCAFDSGEDVAHGWRGEPRSAVGAIDVQPHPELLADVRHVCQVVDEALVGGPRRGDDREDIRMPGQHRMQRRAGEVVAFVFRHGDDVDVECLGRAVDG